jgi:hypothetical protein
MDCKQPVTVVAAILAKGNAESELLRAPKSAENLVEIVCYWAFIQFGSAQEFVEVANWRGI